MPKKKKQNPLMEENLDEQDVETSAQAAEAPETDMPKSAPRKQKKSTRGGGSIIAIVLLALAILLFVAGGLTGLIYYRNYEHLQQMQTTVDARGFYPGVTIDGQDVGGRGYEEVREEILARQQAEAIQRVLTVQVDGRTYSLPATSTYDTEQVIVDAYNYAKTGALQERYDAVSGLQQQPLNFATTCNVTVDGIDAFVESIALDVDVAAVDAQVASFDAATKTFQFTDEVNGRVLDTAQLKADIESAIAAGNYAASITPVINEVPALVTKEQLAAQNTLLGTFTTETTNSTSRNTNIKICSEAFNGYVIGPGEEFSINTVTGERTEAKGYKPAGSIQGGVLIDEFGGGVCQVSSTLFNAVIRSGCIEITERWGHSWPSDYVKIGMDAAIDYPAKDFKFINTSDSPIYLVSTFENRKLTVDVYGKPVLPEGVTIELRSTTDETLERGEDKMVFDPDLAPGETEQVRKGRDGKKSTTYIQQVKDGKVIDEKVLFTTTYPAIRAIINYGPEPTPTVTPEPTPGPNDTNVWP